MTHQHTDKTII